MSRDHIMVSASGSIVSIIVLLNIIVLKAAYISNPAYYWLLLLLLPLLLLAVYNIKQKKHSAVRNYPVIGYLMFIRPEMRQTHFEPDDNGKPFKRRQRPIVHQRSNNRRQPVAFGIHADSGKSENE